MARFYLPTGKTRITAYLDDIVIERFKGYQTLINEALRAYLEVNETPLTVDTLRRVLREELLK